MKKNFTYAFCLLTASLALAYWASLPKSDNESKETTWTKIEKSQINNILYSSADVNVEIYKRAEAGGHYWVKYFKKAADEKSEDTNDSFKANDKVQNLVEYFQPLRVKRVLGALSDDKKKEFGLDADPATTLQIKDASGNLVLDFKMGKRSFGSRNYFVYDNVKKTVLLLNGSRIEDVSKAQARMYEKSPYDIDFDDIDSASLIFGAQTKKFSRTKKDKDGALGWSDTEADAKVKVSYNGWMRKISKLRVIKYANDEQTASVKQATPIFTLKFFKKGEEMENVSLFKTTLPDGKPGYWIKTNHISAIAKINTTRAETLEKDVPAILGES